MCNILETYEMFLSSSLCGKNSSNVTFIHIFLTNSTPQSLLLVLMWALYWVVLLALHLGLFFGVFQGKKFEPGSAACKANILLPVLSLGPTSLTCNDFFVKTIVFNFFYLFFHFVPE